jgi:hypothetical protein
MPVANGATTFSITALSIKGLLVTLSIALHKSDIMLSVAFCVLLC